MTQSLNQVLRQMRAKYPRATYVVDDVPDDNRTLYEGDLNGILSIDYLQDNKVLVWGLTSLRRPTASLSASRKRPSTKARAGGLIPAFIWVSIPYQEAARTVNPLVNTSVGSTPTWPTIRKEVLSCQENAF